VKLVTMIASAWAGIYAADQFVCDGRLLPALSRLARSIARRIRLLASTAAADRIVPSSLPVPNGYGDGLIGQAATLL
jgi:hypothetical protein